MERKVGAGGSRLLYGPSLGGRPNFSRILAAAKFSCGPWRRRIFHAALAVGQFFAVDNYFRYEIISSSVILGILVLFGPGGVDVLHPNFTSFHRVNVGNRVLTQHQRTKQ